jgi:excisionase family DNA binding protein
MERENSLVQTPSTFPRENLLLENQLLTYKQAAKYLGMSESYLRRLKGEGQIPFIPLGSRGVRFRVISLNRWTEKREMTW